MQVFSAEEADTSCRAGGALPAPHTSREPETMRDEDIYPAGWGQALPEDGLFMRPPLQPHTAPNAPEDHPSRLGKGHFTLRMPRRWGRRTSGESDVLLCHPDLGVWGQGPMMEGEAPCPAWMRSARDSPTFSGWPRIMPDANHRL